MFYWKRILLFGEGKVAIERERGREISGGGMDSGRGKEY